MMQSLMIVDLKMDEKLDGKALAAVRGGFVDSAWIYDSALIGSPVTSSFYNEYNAYYFADNKTANVTQNTLALFGSQAASNAVVSQLY
jgi:hypothetical protein